VGGCVRDLLLGYEPKDFDIVTNASPDEILPLFRNSRRIGRRFELIHVRYGREIIEVATYRGLPEVHSGADKTESGRLLRDNVFGTQEEDALRRDFTVNALYYNYHDFSVIDYVGGVDDLEAGWLRVIGNPETRFREDPVRMLRAVRFAAKLGFRIEKETVEPMKRLAVMLDEVPAARRFEEVLKLFQGGSASTTFELLRQHHLFEFLFPMTDKALDTFDNSYSTIFVPRALQNTDTRISEGKPVTPAFLFAVMLWGPVRQRQRAIIDNGFSPAEALRDAAGEVLARQSSYTSIPRRFSGPMREIWNLQARFERRRGKMAFRLLEHERFRAAYDFLLLRVEAGEIDSELSEWWTRFQEVPESERRQMVNQIAGQPRKKSRKRRRHKNNE